MNVRKLFSRWAERIQTWSRRYDMPFIAQRKFDNQECDAIQALVESPYWEMLKAVRDNVNDERNRRAIGFCDGRSFVEFKKMEGLNEFIDTIEEIANLNRKKTEPAKEPTERPRKLEEYVPR